MIAGMLDIARYWMPPKVDQSAVAPKLERFYSERADYHNMTAREDKLEHPQVRLLLERIIPDDIIVEFGCGGGVVLSAAGQQAKEAIGFDMGDIAIAKANSRPGRHRAIKSDAAKIPLPDDYADIAYSFEVLEHVWNPADVIREMVRVVKPGGTVLFTTPNGYAMVNLYLQQRTMVGIVNHLGAVAASVVATMRTVPFQNIPPDLDASPVYPDCDMITRIHPRKLPKFATKAGCSVERLETFFFLKDKAESEAERKRFERLEVHPFYRWYGDHILFVGRKNAA